MHLIDFWMMWSLLWGSDKMTTKIWPKGIITGMVVATVYILFSSAQYIGMDAMLFFAIYGQFFIIGLMVGLAFDVALNKYAWRTILVGMLTPIVNNTIAMLQGSEYTLYVLGENLLVGGFVGGVIYLIFRFKKW